MCFSRWSVRSCGCNEVDNCNCCIAYNKRLRQQHGCELDLALNMFKELIDEHFELLDGIQRIIDKAKELSDSNDGLKGLYFIAPYKFEDLKPNMWVFDCVKNRVNKIIVTFVYGCPYIKLDDGFGEWFIVGYEENRFFPMQMANMVLNNG